MNGIKSVWPLVVFTTCAPLCAGAWVVAAALALTEAFPGAGTLTTGPYGVALGVLLALSLACSTLHLGKPTKALRAFMRLGNSTVSNEVFTGALFAIFLVLYLLMPQDLVQMSEIWMILLVLVAAFAALFVLFQCLAYRMRTVATWNSFAFAIEFAVIALLGGICVEGALAGLVLSAPFDVRVALVVVEVVCCVGMVSVVHAQGIVVAKSVANRPDAQVALGRWGRYGAARVLVLVVGSVMWGAGMLAGQPVVPLVVAGAAAVVAGIVVGRCAFYRFYVNAGLAGAPLS